MRKKLHLYSEPLAKAVRHYRKVNLTPQDFFPWTVEDEYGDFEAVVEQSANHCVVRTDTTTFIRFRLDESRLRVSLITDFRMEERLEKEYRRQKSLYGRPAAEIMGVAI